MNILQTINKSLFVLLIIAIVFVGTIVEMIFNAVVGAILLMMINTVLTVRAFSQRAARKRAQRAANVIDFTPRAVVYIDETDKRAS